MSETKGRLSGPERRERIVEAAREVFTEHDYDLASMGEIAQRAGVSRPVLYDYFPSKKALLLSLLALEMTELAGFVAETIGADGEPLDRLRETIDVFLRFVQERPFGWRTLYLDSALDEEIAAAGRGLRATAVEQIGQWLEPDADRAGLPPGIYRDLSVTMIMAALRGAVEWWQENPSHTREEVATVALELTWLGGDRLSRGERLT
ncbi:TetR/AcrR family transcriptional regulator [Pseudonocardiaceae bacterium YIM PH 21723]|nr:TetR/AcrR family transcriptional regulator [Pseudonocardiaceae bacterium YIM PH 21723]